MAVIAFARSKVQHSVVGGTITSLDLPRHEELIEGDLVMLVMFGGWTEDPGSEAMTIDPRMTVLAENLADEFFECHLEISTMTVGATGWDRRPINVKMVGSHGGPGLAHYFVNAHIVVLRNDDGTPVDLDLTRKGGNSPGGGYPYGHPKALPPERFYVPGEGDAALGIYLDIGGIGGVYDRQDWSRVAPTWRLASDFGVYLTVNYFLTDVPVVPTMLTPHIAGGALDPGESDPGVFNPGGPIWTYGLTLQSPPVTRLYPRDDGLGLSSAPRLYPPPRGPRGGRIIGGHS